MLHNSLLKCAHIQANWGWPGLTAGGVVLAECRGWPCRPACCMCRTHLSTAACSGSMHLFCWEIDHWQPIASANFVPSADPLLRVISPPVAKTQLPSVAPFAQRPATTRRLCILQSFAKEHGSHRWAHTLRAGRNRQGFACATAVWICLVGSPVFANPSGNVGCRGAALWARSDTSLPRRTQSA